MPRPFTVSDAVGGVINLILRKDFTGAESGGRYGTDRNGEYETKEAWAIAGVSRSGWSMMLSIYVQNGRNLPVFDFFGVPGANAPETIDALRTTLHRNASVDQRSFDLRGTGTLFEIPAGDVSVALGGEWRAEETSSAASRLSAAQQPAKRGAPHQSRFRRNAVAARRAEKRNSAAASRGSDRRAAL